MPPPLAGSSQGVLRHPPATYNLLHELAPAHQRVFPLAPLPQQGLTRPDTNDDDTVQGRKEMADKSALLRVVLGGWLEGLAAEETQDGSHADNGSTETITNLSVSIDGPIQYLRGKPRVLLYRPEASSLETTTILHKLPPTQADTPLDFGGATADEDDLATFLLPRILRAASSLQAALLSSPAPEDVTAQDASTKLWIDRSNLLRQLESFVQTVVGILAESAMRVEWEARDLPAQGGIGKAQEMMSEMVKLLQDLLPTPPAPTPPPFPRTILLFAQSKSRSILAHGDPFNSTRPSITVRSTLHARALLLTTLRILFATSATSAFLCDFTPSIVDIVAESWPKSLSHLSPTMIIKGKERADANDARVKAASLEMVAEALEHPSATFTSQAMQLLSTCTAREFNGRLRSLERLNGPDDSSNFDLAEEAIDVALARIMASLWKQMGKHQWEDSAGSKLKQVFATVVGQSDEWMVECLIRRETNNNFRAASLLVLSLPVGGAPSDSTRITLAADLLSSSGAQALIDFVSRHPTLPFHASPTLVAPSVTAWTHLRTALAARSSLSTAAAASPPTTDAPRKRKRDEDLAHPSSDVVEMDGVPVSTQGRRRKVPWREAVVEVLKRADFEELSLESEGLEKMISRLAKTLPTSAPARAISILNTIGLLGCARDASLTFLAPRIDQANASQPACAFCDASELGVLMSPVQNAVDSTTTRGSRVFTDTPIQSLASIAATMLQSDAIDSKVRLAFLKTFPKLLRHSRSTAAALNLDGSDPFVALVLRELQAEQRTPRMAAGNILVAIVQAHQENDPSTLFVGELVKRLDACLTQERPAVIETTLEVIGKIARLAVPQGLLECECLVRFVSRLGHPNTFLKSVARTQLEQVAASRDIKTYALVQPHFARIAPILVGSRSTSSTIFTAALECFHQPREGLLRITREYTLPSLVLHDQRQLLAQIAAASDVPIPIMLTQGDTASAILAFLYMRDDRETNMGLRVFLREVNVGSKQPVALPRILESVKVPLVYKLALELGDEDPRVSAQAERALKNVERAGAPASTGTSSKASKEPKVELGTILKNCIVGILSHMNRGLNESTAHRPLRDKQRIIRSLQAVTVRVGPAIAGFSPQIMATLQSALEVEGLRGVTIHAFKSFIESLKFNEIGPFIGPTTATFVRLWPDFAPGDRATAAEMFNYIVVKNADNLADYVRDVADLSGIPELVKENLRLTEIRKSWTFATKSEHLLGRISSENAVVTLQALKELKHLMAGATEQLQGLSAGDSYHPSVGLIVKSLFGAAVRDGPENEQIRNMAFECIGILGALDPDRLEVPPGDAPIVVLDNFTNQEESIEFALRLIQDLLIGAYRSTNDTKHQEFLAFAIQELLSFCGFTADLVLPPGSSTKVVDTATRARWENLPKHVLETCGPLLGGSFSFKEKSMPREAEYPIYMSTSSYRDWIRIFANDLILRLDGAVVKRVFGAFPPVLHLEDIAVAQHLLPHLVLSTLISGPDKDRMRVRYEMETVLMDQVSPSHQLSENSRLLTAQTVFDLMDHLSRYITKVRQRQAEANARRKQSRGKNPQNRVIEEALLNVEACLQDIPHILVGEAALTCKAYARSLLNFESHIVLQRQAFNEVDESRLQQYYESLHECYADLDEPDGMEGISTRIISPSVQHQIRDHESTGRWTSAQSCWEVMLQQKPDEPANHVGLLRCLRNLGHYDSMRTHIVGILHSRSDEADWDRILAPFNIEASLFVSDWDAVEDALKTPEIEGPEVAFGKVISAMKDGSREQLERACFEAREQLGAPIVAAGKESYRRVYDSVVNLHILHELEAIHLHREHHATDLSPALLLGLSARLDSTSPSFRAREPILNMRRTALRLASSESARSSIADLWLETSKIARKAGHSQTAYSAILQARDLHAPFVFLQSAKLLKANDQPYKAIQDIDNALRSLIPPTFAIDETGASPLIKRGRPTELAKASLRRARWMHEAGRLEHNDIVTMYKEAGKLAPDWETPHYYLGHHWDQLSESANSKKQKLVDETGFRAYTVTCFIQALALGTKYIYQAMPRMLTIWLETGDQPLLLELIKTKKKNPSFAAVGKQYEMGAGFDRLNKQVLKSVKMLPAYQWLTVLPQLVSRILHPNDRLFDTLEKILLRVLGSYPHHGFWAMASGAKSNGTKRSRRNMKVLEKAKASENRNPSDIVTLVDEGLLMVNQLLALCNYNITKTDNLSLSRLFPTLFNMTPTSLIIPLQNSLNVSLPSDASQMASHKPFPDRLVIFQKFDDTITIMHSLQRPRKITVYGDDGGVYSFLCKPKDDLRKDARLMEFNSMIIKLLKKDGDARSRRLGIRTYAVVPLNEDCGLIEWVPHVVVLRGILNKLYASRGVTPWSQELKKTFDTIRDDPKTTGDRFVEEVQKKFPPVFHEWFLETFPEPSAWLRARLAYSRTAAVMSMVGFVLGLGDRHCENILLDGTTGDTVHVDFNCLFDRGRTFDVAEQVPFRLTGNIIDGMGVNGVEGVYRRAAEITLRILRDNKDSLMSVLETFLHDPLVEWVPSNKRGKDPVAPDDMASHVKQKAKTNLDPIGNKLRGLQVTSTPESLGEKEVSVGEQVERLIREARNPKNLGSMYVGWCAWY